MQHVQNRSERPAPRVAWVPGERGWRSEAGRPQAHGVVWLICGCLLLASATWVVRSDTQGAGPGAPAAAGAGQSTAAERGRPAAPAPGAAGALGGMAPASLPGAVPTAGGLGGPDALADLPGTLPPQIRLTPAARAAPHPPALLPLPESPRVVGPPSLSLAMIATILDCYHSPARPAAGELYAVGQKYGIDPAFGLAWFVHESRAGTRGIAPILRSMGNLHAWAGALAYEGFLSYPTWEAGIDDWFWIIKTDYVQKRGLRTVAQIVAHYDGPDDPQDLPSVTSDIETLVQAWRRAAAGTGPQVTGPYPIAGPAPTAPIATPAPSERADLLPHADTVSTEFGHYPDGSPHYGLDVRAPMNLPQTAPVGGLVEEVHRGCVTGDDACGRGWGNHIWWRSAVTGHHILLGHFQTIDPAVHVGATVRAGQVLGLTGMTGYSTGPHIHIQVNPAGLADTSAIQPALEFPWLSCGGTRPLEDSWWGNAFCP